MNVMLNVPPVRYMQKLAINSTELNLKFWMTVSNLASVKLSIENVMFKIENVGTYLYSCK